MKMVLILTMVSLFSLSCTTKTANLYEGTELSSNYSQIFEKYSRSKSIYSGVDTKFRVCGTLFSPEFRKSLLREYYSIYYLDDNKKSLMHDFIEEKTKDKVRFVVAVYTADDRANDIAEKESMWSLFLVTGDERKIKASSITTLSLSNEEISRFFPFGSTDWYSFYDVVFPLGEGGEFDRARTPYLKLVLASPMGKAVLIYTP